MACGRATATVNDLVLYLWRIVACRYGVRDCGLRCVDSYIQTRTMSGEERGRLTRAVESYRSQLVDGNRKRLDLYR